MWTHRSICSLLRGCKKGSRTPAENDKPQISIALSDFSARVTGKSCAAHHLVMFGSVLSELLLLLCLGLVSMMGGSSPSTGSSHVFRSEILCWLFQAGWNPLIMKGCLIHFWFSVQTYAVLSPRVAVVCLVTQCGYAPMSDPISKQLKPINIFVCITCGIFRSGYLRCLWRSETV